MCLAPGHLGRGDGHHRARDVAVAPAGDIAARRIHGDRLLACNKARRDLHLHIRNGGFLQLGKAADIVMGEPDVCLELLWNQRDCRIDLFLGEDHIALIPIEFRGIFQRCRITARFDVPQNLHHRILYIRRIGGGREGRFLQVFTGFKGVTGHGLQSYLKWAWRGRALAGQSAGHAAIETHFQQS